MSSSNQTPRIKLVRSTNAGSSWSVPVFVDTASNTSQDHPAITVSADGRVTVSYYVIYNITNWDVYTTATWDWGTTFLAPQRTTDTTSNGTLHSSQNDYIGTTSTITQTFPVWTDYRHSTQSAFNADIYTAGVSFPTSYNYATAYGCSPKTVYSNNTGLWNTIFLTNGNLYHASSADDGTTWSTARVISGSVPLQLSSDPVVVQDSSGNLDVVFASSQGLYFTQKTPAGSWISPVQLYSTGASSYPTLVVDGNGTGHVVFVSKVVKTYYLYYGTFTPSTPGSLTIQAQIDGGTSTITGASLTQLTSGELQAVWSKSGEIYFSSGTGSTWDSPLNLSNNTGASEFPCILSYGSGTSGSTQVVWQDNTTGNYEIYYVTKSTPGGWNAVENISNNSTSSKFPFISSYKYLGSYDTPLIMWSDSAPGNFDVYYVMGASPIERLTTTSQSSLYPSFTQRPTQGGSRLLAIWTEYPNKVLSKYLDNPVQKRSAEAAKSRFSYQLWTNYPNPFNPTSVIRYSLAENSVVRLDVFNLIGERVAKLKDEFEIAGVKEVRFDGARLASGLYFYRLEAVSSNDPLRKFESVRKMLLIK